MKLGAPKQPDKPPAEWSVNEIRVFIADFRRLLTLSNAYHVGRETEIVMLDLMEILTKQLPYGGGPPVDPPGKERFKNIMG